MKKNLFGLIIVTLFFFGISTNCTVYAGSQSVFEDEVIEASTSGNPEASNIINKIKNFANIFAAIVLSISIISVVYGGLRYITSTKYSAKEGSFVKIPEKILIYSGIGIIVSLSAFAIARLFASFGF